MAGKWFAVTRGKQFEMPFNELSPEMLLALVAYNMPTELSMFVVIEPKTSKVHKAMKWGIVAKWLSSYDRFTWVEKNGRYVSPQLAELLDL